MAGRYVISDYKTAADNKPRISVRTRDLTEAEEKFASSAKKKVRSVVLYNTGTDMVLKIAIDGEPIYLVEAIDKAREELESNALVNEAVAKVAAGIVIEQMVRVMTGVEVPGLGDAVADNFIFPYSNRKGDGAAAVAGVFGGLSGAVIGNSVLGHIGSLVGAATVGACASALIKYLFPPSPKCTACKGTGLVDDFRRCKECYGSGYHE